jgi:hypothetical protein
MGKFLSQEVAEKFEVVNTNSPILHSKIGDIDFRRITLEQAAKIVSLGSSYLREKKSVKAKKK